ncbi:MAG: hypothetical protein LBS01_05250 [Prevotellaceae bacterium]|jgi:hypothetical protein|nr:hypothetical protein [Prevotellaceae bacterium]
MIYIKKRAYNDFNRIMKGMLKWKRVVLSEDFIQQYIQKIIDICYTLDSLPLHHNTSYLKHKKFGEKVYSYKINKHTTQYIIYDIDKYKNIIIKKILSNHLTDK